MLKFKYNKVECVYYAGEKTGIIFYEYLGETKKWEVKTSSLKNFMKIIGGKIC